MTDTDTDINTTTDAEEMAAVLQDVFTLCEQGEFEPDIFLDFIRSGKTRNLMQYHRDYFLKTRSKN